MSLFNEIAAKLIAKGKAQPGHYVGGLGGVSRIAAPANGGLIITRIEMSAFADIAAPSTFLDAEDVMRKSWHQLTVWTQKGQQNFQMRHNLVNIVDDATGDIYTLPQGKHVFDCWINAQDYALFQITRVPHIPAAAFVLGQVPGRVDIPPVPNGYGHEPTGIGNNVLRFEWVNAGIVEAKPLGNVLTPNLPISYNQNQWPIALQTSLNPPQLTIPFSELTIPVLNIDYLIVQGNPDETFKGAI